MGSWQNTQRANGAQATRKNLRICAREINSSSSIHNASWSGYNSPYVKNIISAGTKVLKLLGALTFDVQLLFWTKGLENHLKNRMKEAEKEAEELEKLKFKTTKQYR
jgi:hypothetical protein